MNSLSEPAHVSHNGFRFSLLTDLPGRVEVPAMDDPRVSIHAGPPVRVSCRRAGHYHSGTSVYGDIHVIPAGTPSAWEISGKDTFLALIVSSTLLDRAAEELDLDPRRVEITNRFQVRDTQLENIGWVLREEMECGCPCGPDYIESLGMAVAIRLLCCHSSRPVRFRKPNKRLSDRRLRNVFAYVEDNLAGNITLRDLAAVVGLSVSHFKILFREAVGVSPHQYLIKRRVERARDLLGEDELSIGQIAIETGFVDQSHLGRHTQRILGVSPRALRQMLRGH
ncbi:MAG TPA: AraC family transcriptional regulator [Blastocatellia bacterium]|nr:AraC family transcriptional regulator [Blastocatellia bacterium]